ncbi:MAG TPA: bifunctional demethylmenaquinone methyltransferase/2-methoxy-6-polyprenyl-1,4-benzoquinol methylase UbiE, partial [Segetibacter sp.]
FEDSGLKKKQQVAQMFDKIAGRYDFLNRFLSVGIDVGWRKKAIRELQTLKPQSVLDVAPGTGDVAILTHKILKPNKIVGIDISEGMLELGRKKIERLHLNNNIELLAGDSENIKFSENYFDAVTVAFGVRNFENLEQGLQEILRVLKPGGKLVVLEFSKPKQKVFKDLYNLYMQNIAPAVVSVFSKNKKAYKYLNDSVQQFPEGQNFIDILSTVGFKNTYNKALTFGICSIYCGSK